MILLPPARMLTLERVVDVSGVSLAVAVPVVEANKSMWIGPVNLELAELVILRRTVPSSPSMALVGNEETITPSSGEAGSCAGVGLVLPELPLPLEPPEPLFPLEPEEDPLPIRRSTTDAALGEPRPVAVS